MTRLAQRAQRHALQRCTGCSRRTIYNARTCPERIDIRAVESARARKILGREATEAEANELTRERWRKHWAELVGAVADQLKRGPA